MSQDPIRWYRLTLSQDAKGPRQRTLTLSTGPVRLSLFQTNAKAQDAPSQLVRMRASEAEELRALDDYIVAQAKAPKGTALGQTLATRKLKSPPKANTAKVTKTAKAQEASDE